jgi:hypothetical protein
MMAKRKATKRRKCRADCIPDQAPHHAKASHSAGLPHTIPLEIPTYWSPEQAIAVYEIIDDLRERIWSIYQTNLQDLMQQQRQSAPIYPLKIDDEDIPF